ncbi:hypothetical protein RB195_010688 [Necator americanus]|uniref:Uncharacterized protein n=1 Tax=Necator americanus TaxID=51031 RepID=A0ABR1D0D2_NECAM
MLSSVTSSDARTTGRPPTRWSDFFTKSFKEKYDALRVPRERKNHWATLARDRDKWKNYWRPLDQFEDQRESRDHIKTLLNRQAPSVPELEHVDRPTYAVKEEPPTMSGVFDLYPEDERWEICGDDVISAEMLKYLPPSGIREMTEIISLIWIDKKIPDSWRHAIIIPLHKKLPVTDSRNYRGIGY